ncbi:hypothetical protein [Nostoc sp.]|uniref:hypothetical protein n=1 Tax=Nostoc sp. TaxID=1180 RepID=UPI002FF8EB8D
MTLTQNLTHSIINATANIENTNSGHITTPPAMKSAEFRVPSAELKDRPQGAGYQPTQEYKDSATPLALLGYKPSRASGSTRGRAFTIVQKY